MLIGEDPVGVVNGRGDTMDGVVLCIQLGRNSSLQILHIFGSKGASLSLGLCSGASVNYFC